MAKKKDSVDHGDRNGEGGGGGGSGEPDFNDPPDFVDDITDEELCGDVLRNRPKETDGIENVIVVDGLPLVGEDRLEKLKGVVKKIFSKFGTINSEFFASNLPEGQTTSYMFIEFTDASIAAEAVKTMDGYKFDKNHTLMVNLFTDFDKYENIVEDWKTPEPQPYRDAGNLWYHLMEPDSFDQYLLVKLGVQKGMGANDIQVYLNSAPEPVEMLNRVGGTDTIAKWSPLGTYLATFHTKGVAVWGGEKFEKINRFAHNNAEFIDFSPNERYLVTFSPKAERAYDPEVLVIWEIRTGAKKRTFTEVHKSPWPVIRWSHDDKYFARMGFDTLSVYETPSFRLQENKSLKITGIRDFTWSPSDNIIAYWVAENKDVPARVVLIEIPSRAEIRAKNLFNVADCRMHWQKSGDYLCVKVDRYTKVIKKDRHDAKYSGMFYNFEVFHLREKQVPVDSVEIKEPIIAFAWEPVGSKFAIIHGEQNSIATSFWGVKKGDTPSLLKKIEKKRYNSMFWAPQGQFIVLALLKSAEGPLEFIDTSDFTTMNTLMPEMTTDVEWDPTGRYVVAGVSAWGGKMSDTGYTLLNFQGRLIRKERVDRFGNFFWRPRPPCLLTHAQVKEIKKNLKKYAPAFESKDKMRRSKANQELYARQEAIMSTWEEYRTRKNAQFAAQKAERLNLRNNVDTDELDSDKSQLNEEIFEILIKEDVQPVE